MRRQGHLPLQVLEIMQAAAGTGVAIHMIKNAMVMNGSMQSKIYATIFGLAAEIERDFISQHTREGLARCRADGAELKPHLGKLEFQIVGTYFNETSHQSSVRSVLRKLVLLVVRFNHKHRIQYQNILKIASQARPQIDKSKLLQFPHSRPPGDLPPGAAES
jgi:DNA invertase Pin-like site-specific DNA recombinase